MSSITADQPISQIKIIAVGDTGVGKSSILTRFAHDKFNQFSEPTLGAAFITKRHTLPEGRVIQFHIWDTAGQQKYKSIAPIYYRQAKIALCVYDICSMHSYQVMKRWVDQLKQNGPKDIVLAVVGNKIDKYDQEEVQYTMVKQYAASIGALLKLVSAKQGKNIADLFNAVAQMVIKKNSPTGQKKGQVSSLKNKNGKKKSTCC